MDIPVYLVVGFLDGGKTNFINGILEDGFSKNDRTLLLCCEEGDEEYNEKFLKNVTVVTVDDQAQLTCSFLKDCETYDKCVFALVRTSNKSAVDLQDKLCGESLIVAQVKLPAYQRDIVLKANRKGNTVHGLSEFFNSGHRLPQPVFMEVIFFLQNVVN